MAIAKYSDRVHAVQTQWHHIIHTYIWDMIPYDNHTDMLYIWYILCINSSLFIWLLCVCINHKIDCFVCFLMCLVFIENSIMVEWIMDMANNHGIKKWLLLCCCIGWYYGAIMVCNMCIFIFFFKIFFSFLLFFIVIWMMIIKYY